MKLRRNLLLGSLVVIALSQSAHAVDITWDDGDGSDNNWSNSDNWSDLDGPAGDDITFNATGTASGTTVTSIVDADYTIDSLRFTHDTTANHTLSISDTLTLTVNGSFTPTNGQATAVLFGKPDTNDTATTNITGLGTFTVNSASNHFLVGFQANNSNTSSRVVVDMSGLTNFNATVNIFGVGRKGTTDSTTTRRHESGQLWLAQNSNVTATAITVGDTTKIDGTTSGDINQGIDSTLFLSAGGDRVNNLNADTMIFGRGKATGIIEFATGAVSSDSVKLRGTGGGETYVTDFILGDRNVSASSGPTSGTANFGAGEVDALITNLYVGRWGTGAGTSKVNPTGTFTMGTNANSDVTVTTAYLALGQSSFNPSAAQVLTGNLNVTGGIFSVGTLNLATGSTHSNVTRVANVTVDGGTFRFGTINAPTTNGSANINFNSGAVASIDGTARSLGLAYNLGKVGGSTVTFGQASGGTGKLTFSGGATLLGNTALTTLVDTTLSGAIGGGFSITKDGSASLTLSGTNGYTGGTDVSEGLLTFLNTNAKAASGTHDFDAGTTLGLGVATSGSFFNATDITNAFSGTMTGNLSNVTVTATTHVGIDTSNGDFDYGDSIAANPTKGLTKLGANILSLSGTNTYSGATTISAGTLQIGNGGTVGTLGTGAVANAGTLAFNRTDTYTLGSGNLVTGAGTVRLDSGTVAAAVDNQFNTTGSLTFGTSAGATTVAGLDLASGSSTFASMLVQTDSASANTLAIGSGKTLQINGAVTVGYNSAATSTTKLTATGLGTLSIGTSVTPTNANVRIGNGQTDGVSNGATLDMSGLSTFYANLGTGSFSVGDPTNSTGTGTAGSTLILAADSTIQAATLTTSSPSGSITNAIKLGSGTNILNVDTLTVGGNLGRSNGTLTFNTGTGTLKVRSQADPVNGRATLNVGNLNFGTGLSQTGNVFDTTGHSADLYFGTMTIGSRGDGTGTTTGTFIFDTGTLDANDLVVGNRSFGSDGTATTTGIVNLGGGTAVFNSSGGPVRLGTNTSNVTGSTATGTLNISGGSVTVAANAGNSFRLGDSTKAGGTANGTLNLTGGTLTVAGDIIRGSATGTSNATLNLDGGTLDMGGNEIGGSVVSSNLTSLTFASGTLKNVAEINNGADLTKTTGGILTLSGTNTYNGETSVTAGTLVINGDNSGAIGNVTVNNADTRLKGTGTIGGDTTINVGAIHSVGSSVGTQTFDDGASTNLTYAEGSIFEWELGATLKDSDTMGAARGTDWDAVNVSGNLATTGAGAIFRVVLDDDTTFADTFWTQNREWTDIFKTSEAGSAVNFASIFSSFQHYNYSGVDGALADLGSVSSFGSFTISGSTLNWTAVPEPTSALVGLLITAGLLRRRRAGAC